MGLFGVFPIFVQPGILKTAGRTAKRTNMWVSGVSNQCIQGAFES